MTSAAVTNMSQFCGARGENQIHKMTEFLGLQLGKKFYSNLEICEILASQLEDLLSMILASFAFRKLLPDMASSKIC
jgi:hypothetical protein